MDKDQMLRGPALRPPPGHTPNLNHDYAPEQFTFYICVVLCTVFSGIFMLLRAYTHFIVVKKWNFDEYLLIVGYLLFIALIAVGRVTLNYGIGVHQWNVTLGDFFDNLYWLNIFQILYPPCCLCLKVAIVLQYLRMFAPVRSLNMFMFVGGWATIICNVGYYIPRMFLAIFECRPREKIWNKLYEGGSCINGNNVHISTGFFNILTDLVILLLPIRSVWQLSIPRRKKLGISLLFASGLLANIGTALRTYYGVVAEDGGDWSYNMAWDGLWAYAELSLGFIVACAITLPKLTKEKKNPLGQYFTSVTSLWKKSSSQNSSGSGQKGSVPVSSEGKESNSGIVKVNTLASDEGGNLFAAGGDWDETIRRLA